MATGKELKQGDRIVGTGIQGPVDLSGRTGTVIKQLGIGSRPVSIKFDTPNENFSSGSQGQYLFYWVDEENIELINPKFQTGDRVTIVSNNTKSVQNGTVRYSIELDQHAYVDLDNSRGLPVLKTRLRHLYANPSPEEPILPPKKIIQKRTRASLIRIKKQTPLP